MEAQQSVIDLLASMGVTDYEPSVLVALEEYGRRVATDLLCDAKDFATHASRKEIDEEDVALAITLRDKKHTVQSTFIRSQQDAQINSAPLPLFPEDGVINASTTLNKAADFPPLLSRPYTYVPGHVAYNKEEESNALSSSGSGQSSAGGGGASRGGGAKKQQIPIIMHPEKRGR